MTVVYEPSSNKLAMRFLNLIISTSFLTYSIYGAKLQDILETEDTRTPYILGTTVSEYSGIVPFAYLGAKFVALESTEGECQCTCL